MWGSQFERQGAHHDPNEVRVPIVKTHGEHVIIKQKEHVEKNTLGTINALTQTLIHCASPLVEEESFLCRGHICTSCGFLCTFSSHVGDNMDDGIFIDEFLSDTFGSDTQVN